MLLSELSEPALAAYLKAVPLLPFTPHTLTTKDTLQAVLRQVRERGYAIADQQMEPHIRTIAVPVRNIDGDVVAGINILIEGDAIPRREPAQVPAAAAAGRARVAGRAPALGAFSNALSAGTAAGPETRAFRRNRLSGPAPKPYPTWDGCRARLATVNPAEDDMRQGLSLWLLVLIAGSLFVVQPALAAERPASWSACNGSKRT